MSGLNRTILSDRAGLRSKSPKRNQRQDADAKVKVELKRDFRSMTGEHDDDIDDSRQPFHSVEVARRIKPRMEDVPPAEERDNTSHRTERLCTGCRELNLEVLMRALKSPRGIDPWLPAPWIHRPGLGIMVDVGFRYRTVEGSACDLCRLLGASRVWPKADQGTYDSSSQDSGDNLWATSLSRKMPMRTRMFRQSLFDSTCLVLVPRGRLISRSYMDTQFSQFSCAVLFENTTVPALFMPRLIPARFDVSVVKSWLSYCISNHRLLCETKPLPVNGVYVINCETLAIEPYSAYMSYAALSYVWATAKDTCGSVQIVKGRRVLPSQLSRVIHDSIEVTKALGYRHLWIDKFCIDQDVPTTKHDQIQQMDAIYQNSELTIIAAAGMDETHGLPGVGATQRSEQLVARLNFATALQMPRDPHEVIADSHWSKRGWTFQEALLSCRRLVFTDDQVYFQCNTMNCFESVYCPLDEMHVKGKVKTYEGLRSGYFGRNNHNEYGKLVRDKHTFNQVLCQYLANVEEFTGRSLRFEQDSLNAFRGIMKQSSSSQRHPLHHAYGLAYTIFSKKGLKVFARSLSWMHADNAGRPRRRSMFPSWTWAGWEGRVDHRLTGAKEFEFNTGLKGLGFRGIKGNIFNSGDSVETENFLNGAYPILRITAMVVPWTAIACSRNMFEKSGFFWRINSLYARVAWSVDIRDELELFESFSDTLQWQFVYVGSCTDKSYVMVLASCPGGSTWNRAGMFCLSGFGKPEPSLKHFQETRTFDIE